MKALLLVSVLFSFNSFAGEVGEAKSLENCKFSNQTLKRDSKDLPKSSEEKKKDEKGTVIGV